jgi:hypothetical protein
MYVKVFTDILQSSLWCEDSDTRVVWITMLALANQDGIVRSTAPGISSQARVPVEKVREALDKFESEDPDSRTLDHGGRRVERTDGGYVILNYMKYREMTDMAKVREQTRERVRKYRQNRDGNAVVTGGNVTVTTGNDKQKQKQKSEEDPPLSPKGGEHTLFAFKSMSGEVLISKAYIESLQSKFPSLDVRSCVADAHAWTLVNRPKKDIPKFLTNWLIRQKNKKSNPQPQIEIDDREVESIRAAKQIQEGTYVVPV